jgi:SulP family sulfate permease
LVISIFGGSRVQIGGPTGAFIVIVYGIVQKHGVEGLTIATLMAGVLMVAMGLLRFGNLLKFFPHTLVLGFTSGIAVIILSSQVKDFFGLDMGACHRTS